MMMTKIQYEYLQVDYKSTKKKIHWNPVESSGLEWTPIGLSGVHWIPLDSRESDRNRWGSVNYSMKGIR